MVLVLLCPQIPLLFMGEEWGARTPFLFFTDFHDELADAVREGRRREFMAFPDFRDPQRRASIPDPNLVESFERSQVRCTQDREAQEWRAFVGALLHLRQQRIAPFLDDARSTGAHVLGAAAVEASWNLGPGRLWIGVNLGRESVAVDVPKGEVLFEFDANCSADISRGLLPGHSCCALLRAAS